MFLQYFVILEGKCSSVREVCIKPSAFGKLWLVRNATRYVANDASYSAPSYLQSFKLLFREFQIQFIVYSLLTRSNNPWEKATGKKKYSTTPEGDP